MSNEHQQTEQTIKAADLAQRLLYEPWSVVTAPIERKPTNKRLERLEAHVEAALAILDATLAVGFNGNPSDSIGLAARIIRDALEAE